MNTLLIFLVCTALVCSSQAFPRYAKHTAQDQTPLDQYVHQPDPSYAYSQASTIAGVGYTAYVINLTSQTWMTLKETNRPVWQHWLIVCIPDKYSSNTGLLFIDGDNNSPNPPTSIDTIVEPLCRTSGSVVAQLNQIPNQPIIFQNDGVKRVEDAMIAYTWAHFLNFTDDPIWLARLPMTKAAVRAMDTVQSFVAGLNKNPIHNFIVAGASKRGWTTWTTGAVDSRVIGIIPIVMPILNMVPNIGHQWQAYGGWSFALDDYEDQHVMKYLNTPQMLKMTAVVDPYSYINRLTMPKYVICSCGDEFFLPDSPKFFWNDLQGEKHLRMVPDAEHSLIGHQADVVMSVRTFTQLIIANTPRPQFTWKVVPSNTTASITLTLLDDYVPKHVLMWYAHTQSQVRRDFRLIICGDLNNPNCIQPVLWFDTILTPGQDGKTYVAEMSAPAGGWSGFFIEVQYYFNGSPLVFTSEINVVPDTLPFPPCGDNCQP